MNMTIEFRNASEPTCRCMNCGDSDPETIVVIIRVADKVISLCSDCKFELDNMINRVDAKVKEHKENSHVRTR